MDLKIYILGFEALGFGIRVYLAFLLLCAAVWRDDIGCAWELCKDYIGIVAQVRLSHTDLARDSLGTQIIRCYMAPLPEIKCIRGCAC